MSIMISQEQALEYQQVAALVCLDLNCLLKACNICNTLEELRKQVAHVHKMKEELISNKEIRESRYNAARIISSAVAAGEISCEKVS